VRSQRTPATILEVVEGGQRPSAEQRKMLAEMWNEVEAPFHLFALVTTSAMARGIFKVVNWLNPPGVRRLESVHSTFPDAAQWLQQQRGDVLPDLTALHERARRNDRSRRGS
ncbi:MAG TPA: hypothetical protein VK524_14695, partial [Polyangiaceae bacterium]|nr:hypothetical protein [Polyangiaceae bacterium]